jgi:hypothetical protein
MLCIILLFNSVLTYIQILTKVFISKLRTKHTWLEFNPALLSKI